MSKTAIMVAACRARAGLRVNPICHDPWALALAGEDGMALVGPYETTFPEMELGVAVRTAFLDAHVGHLTAPGSSIRQVVVLGAGLDTRAARLARDGVTYFEVDQPESQAHKLRRVAQVPTYPQEAARYVPCDFERQDFLSRLIEQGLRADQPALVLWEGVASFLTPAAVHRTLRRIATDMHPQTVLVFDYLSAGPAARGPRQQRLEHAGQVVTSVGEPYHCLIEHPVPILHGAGFRRMCHAAMDEICLNLTGRHDPAHGFFLVWQAALASVSCPVTAYVGSMMGAA